MDYRTRLILALSAVGGTVLVLSLLMVSILLRQTFEDRILARINSIGMLAAEEITANQERGDLEGIREIVEVLESQPLIRFASILDRRGFVQISSLRDAERKPSPFTDSQGIGEDGEDLYVKSYPLILNRRLQGNLQIGYSLTRFRHDLGRIVGFVGAGSGVMLLLVIGMAYAVSGFLLRPLVRMRSLATRIAAGDFSGRMSVGTRDVIGQLSESFNEMSARLLDLTRNLEEKVRIRTGELSEANHRLRQLDRQKSEFISFASHELRSPLSGIRGMASLLRRSEVGEERRNEYLELIENEARRMTALVEDFLCMTRIEAGMDGIRRKPVDLRSLLEEACRIVAVGADVRIRTGFEQLPVVPADPYRIGQVIRNLLDNAVKYSPPGGVIDVTASFRAGRVEVGVNDQGPGISPSDLPHIFEKFYRGGDDLTVKMSGSGIGLAIARSIVEAHGGTIRVESEPGRGAGFLFTLPAAEESEQQGDLGSASA